MPVVTMAGMDAKDLKIERLERLVAEQAAMIEKLVQRVDELERQLAKARKDSSNSSKPPSSDIVKKPKDRRGGRRKGKRKQGGQSVVIWGRLNETAEGLVFQNAVESLPMIRSLDDTRMVMLSSVVRWTCPAKAEYSVDATFAGIAKEATTDVLVLLAVTWPR